MKKLGIFVAVVVGLYVLYRLVYPTYTYRYRMTVEVDVGGEIKSGASVIEVRLSKQPKFLPEVPAVATSVLGDAVFVDLGEGQNVFALLASGPDGMDVDFPQHVVPLYFKLSYADHDLVKFPHLQGSRDLESKLPILVTFADLNDPTTARVVRPDAFEQVFGPGVRFKRAWIEMTGDPVTRGIEQRLPWLRSHKGYLAGPQHDPTWSRPSRNLTGNEFIKGL
jgi:hypothetical protein